LLKSAGPLPSTLQTIPTVPPPLKSDTRTELSQQEWVAPRPRATIACCKMMLFNMEMIWGPPPQEVIDQRPLWFLLMGLLGATLLLRLLVVDIVGAVLCGLLFLLVCIIVRDGMRELPKFSLVFGILCGINLLFYTVPLVSYLFSGRVERHINHPVNTLSDSGREQMTFTLTVRTTPFFDKQSGLFYNVQSVGMLALSICCALGTYLGVSAHMAVQRHMSNFLPIEEGAPDLLTAVRVGDGSDVLEPGHAHYGATHQGGEAGLAPPNRQAPPRQEVFKGTAHKLKI